MTSDAGPAGFALPAVIIAMLLLGALTAAASLMAGQIARMGRAAREGVHALYAAEAGLAHTLALWPDSAVSNLASGEIVTLEPVTLANGDEAVVRIERIDDASSPALARLLVHAYGRARRAPHAGRHLVLALTRRAADTLCCADSALSSPASPARSDSPEACRSGVPSGAGALAAVLLPDDARLTRRPLSTENLTPEPYFTARATSSVTPRAALGADSRYTLCIPTGVPGERPVPVPLAERPWVELYW